MNHRHLTLPAAFAIAMAQTPVAAQSSHPHPNLHVNSRWDECSIQLDPSLTQSAWRQFTQEAGLVAYFRPLIDARPMGRGHFEFSLHQWETRIDDQDAAWNDTFVHPDSAHWLFEGSGLKFPGLMVRAGVGSRTDVGVYFTKNPNANYGFFGAQVQQNLLNRNDWSAATRMSFTSLFGPDDVDFVVLGFDLLASRAIPVTSWATLSPYAGVSSYVALARENSPAVRLESEGVGGSAKLIGAALQLSAARVAVEYNSARVNSVSLKLGFGR